MNVAAVIAFAGAVLAQLLVFFGVLSPSNLASVGLLAFGLILVLLGIMNGTDRKRPDQA